MPEKQARDCGATVAAAATAAGSGAAAVLAGNQYKHRGTVVLPVSKSKKSDMTHHLSQMTRVI